MMNNGLINIVCFLDGALSGFSRHGERCPSRAPFRKPTSGELPFHMLGRRLIVFSRTDLDALMAKYKVA
jgi:hypothetical protein